MYDENQYSEIIKLKNDIEKKAFKQKRIRIFDDRSNKFTSIYFNVHGLSDGVNSFILGIAVSIWNHKQAFKIQDIQFRKKFKKALLAKMVSGELNIERRNLQARGYYSKKSIAEAIKPLKKALNVRLKNSKNMPYYRYLNQTRLMGQARNKQENNVIAEIRSFYQQHTTLSNRQIKSSMALIFEVIEFWNDADLVQYVGRLRKRFEKIDRSAYRGIENL